MGIVRPSCSTGGKGLPVATRAAPSVQRITSAGSASAWEVGLESGMITGISQPACMVRTTSSVKIPGRPHTPISTVGLTRRIVSTSSWPSQPSVDAASWARRRWKSRSQS